MDARTETIETQPQVINLTETAVKKVRQLLDQEGNTEFFLRVAVQPGGCSGLRYSLYFDDRAMDGDIETVTEAFLHPDPDRELEDTAEAQGLIERHGLPDGLKSLPEGVSIHMACHARAQNMGSKAAELLRLIPDTPIDVIERCAGHGGTFGVLKQTHSVAMKVGI